MRGDLLYLHNMNYLAMYFHFEVFLGKKNKSILADFLRSVPTLYLYLFLLSPIVKILMFRWYFSVNILKSRSNKDSNHVVHLLEYCISH